VEAVMEWEPVLRLGVFGGVFAAMALWERFAPRRMLHASRPARWTTNWLIAVLDTAVVRLLFPLAAVGAALDAQAQGWGLFSLLGAPFWLAFAVTLVVFDFAIWAQHLITHKVPLLWRLHQVHHADRDIDVTTAIRFHPIEIALSMLVKIGLVYLLGAPAAAVIAFEVILNGCAMFNHANIRLPRAVDRALRLVIVTPDMHRVHHSVIRSEHDANYGFNLSLWDRLFGTYIPEPSGGHHAMTIGLEPYQTDAPNRLGWSLLLPFRSLRG
jgi:sterol desaturase/sphingolipid hydroxylase (fatty acid hydroxylase superfamily)